MSEKITIKNLETGDFLGVEYDANGNIGVLWNTHPNPQAQQPRHWKKIPTKTYKFMLEEIDSGKYLASVENVPTPVLLGMFMKDKWKVKSI